MSMALTWLSTTDARAGLRDAAGAPNQDLTADAAKPDCVMQPVWRRELCVARLDASRKGAAMRVSNELFFYREPGSHPFVRVSEAALVCVPNVTY